ncbi:MAG: LPD38 domain-containing protein [Candidatus Limimorpha sp.]
MNDEVNKLYTALLSKGYSTADLGDEETFRAKMSDKNCRKELYDWVSSKGNFRLGDYETYERRLTSSILQEQQPASVPASSVGQVNVTKQPQDRTGFSVTGVEEMKRDTQRQMDDLHGRMETMREYRDSSKLGFGNIADGKPRFNPQSGKLEKTYLTPLGNRYASKALADMESDRYRQAADMTVSGQLRRARLKLAELQEKRSQRASEVLDETAEFNKTKLTGLGRALIGGQMYVGMQQGDEENNALDVAIRQTEELIKDLEEQRDREQGKDVGFWRGFGRIAGDFRTWDLGMSDLGDAMTMMHADKLIDENATEGERAAYNEMMGAIHKKEQAEQAYGGNASWWNRAGLMTGYMPAFMLDFAISGGGFKGINVLSKAGTKAATKVVGKKAVEQMAKHGFKTYVKNNGVKGLGKYATNWTVKALGTTADDLLLRAPLMTNTVQAGKTAADIIDRKLGDVVVNEDGTYDFSNDKTWGSAVWQGEANAIIENYSEMFGAHLDPVMSLGNMSKIANTFGAKRLGAVLAKADAGDFGGIMGRTQQLFDKMGVSDYFGEVTEEYYGQLWRTMLNLDDAYQQNPDGTRTNLFATGQFHGDIWGGMALSMGLMGAGKHTLTGAQYASMKHSVNKADAHATELLGKEVWEGMRSYIDATTNENIGELAVLIVNDQQMTDKEKEAVLEYMERSIKLRGFNLGTVANSRGGGQSGEEYGLNQSYIDGYNSTNAQEMADAKNMLDYQRQRMIDVVGTNIEALVDGTINCLNEAKNAPEGSERRQVILDYLNAKQVYDGMMQRVLDDIDMRIEEINGMIEARTNSTTGMIHGATMKVDDRRVYVVGGNVVPYSDGTGIDVANYDESIIVRDAETGELEQVSPDAIRSIDEALDPAVEKQTTADAIRMHYAQEAADKFDGVVTFNPGDTYTITGDDAQIQVQIVANEEGIVDNGDGTVNVSDGTNIFPLAKETIQQQADKANIARVAQFEQERAVENGQAKAIENAQVEQAAQEADRPQYAINDKVTLRDAEGNIIHGEIAEYNEADDDFVLDVDFPIGGKYAPLLTRDELESMVIEYNGTEVNPINTEARNTIQKDNPAIESITETNENESEEGTETSTEQQLTAFERIPKDEQGNPIYVQADTDTAWDAIVEQTEGDEAMAQTVADGMVADKEAALKKVEKAKSKGGATIAEKIAAEKERKAAIDSAKQEVDIWKKIAGTANRRKMEFEAERRRVAEEAALLRRAEEERLRAEREEAERIEREALNGVPDMVDDTPQDARARGYRRVSGHKIDRQEPVQGLQGKEIAVKFGDGVIPTGRVAVIEAEQLQPSHIQGVRNPLHFIDEAQPKERNDEASVLSAQRIAKNVRPEEITSSVTAYTGAPTINARGETIQGNNRSDALRLMWSQNEDQAAKYKRYLIDHAEEFGLNAEDIAAMQRPVLVNMLDVEDADAIALGQYVAQDTESGGTERIKPKNAVQKMGADMRTFANLLLKSNDEETTFAGLIDSNGYEVLKWMSQMGYITPTQYKSAFDSRGGITAEAKNDLRGIMYQSIFKGGSTRLEEMFNTMPAKAQKAILATAFRDYDSPKSESMIEEIQNSIRAYYALSQSEDFINAKTYKDVRLAIEGWKNQYQIDDATGESYIPANNFSNFALLLAAMYKGQNQSVIQGTFNRLYDLIQGTQEANLFETPDNTPRTLAQAIKEALNIDYNGQQGSNVLVGDTSTSQLGQQESTRNAETGERTEDGERTDDSEGSVGGDSRGIRIEQENRGNQAEETTTPQTGEVIGRSLSANEAENLIANMEENADTAPDIELTIENWDTLFGEEGIVATPIGEVKIGENQFTKLMRADRNGKLGMIKPTLEHPHAIVEDTSEAKGDNVTERASSYVFIRSFKKADGSRYYYFTSVTVSKDGKEVVISNQEKSKKRISNLLQNGVISWINKNVQSVSEAQSEESVLLDDSQTATQTDNNTASLGINSSELSDSKDTTNSKTTNELEEKNAIPSVQEQVQAAEAEVNINPTDKQKEAGNYKKGHVQIGTFNVTIEQPKGSVRSGVDANGKKWEIEMQNTYGYIRGTEGVDGDHIDVFLSNDIDGWNGRQVYVIDQRNEDGSFDEHKVMLGFNDINEAEEAYFSNYEQGWQGLGAITAVSIEEFEKWIASSHRKTKAFAEYKSVRKASEQDDKQYTIEPAQYTTKKGKVLDMHLVKFTGELTKEQQRAAKELAKADNGWYDREQGGFMMRSEESAKQLAETIIGNEEAVSDAQPVSMTDIQALNNGDVLFTEPQQVEQTDSEEESPVWQYSIHVDKETGRTTLSRDDVRGIIPIGDGSFRYSTDSPEEMLDILRNPLNGMQEVLDAVGVTLENKIKTRELDRKSKEQTTAENNPSGNRLVTDERYAELRERMRKKLGGQMNIGIDPEILAIGTEMAVYHLEKGARKFTEFAKAMVADLGDVIRPYLKAFYNGARNLPEVEGSEFATDMTPYDEVQTFDVANFDKTGIDALATAETVTREVEVAQEVELAQERIKKTRSAKKETKKKAVNLQQSNELGLFDNETSNEDGLQRTDEERSEGVSANGNRHEQGLSRGTETGSESEQQDSRGTDLGGERTGDAVDRTVRPRLSDTITEKKNTRNNHSERGKDHAPTSVDARIEANIKAIELAKQLLESGEQATEKQMQTLRKFSGWGGLGKAFSEGTYYAPNNIAKKLRELLGEEAYQQAVMSANSAYYTPAYVVDTLWDIAEQMGFEGGNILEGSAGIGNILGQMPTHISERSDIHAIEIDGTSGGILSLLYPDANVEVHGFEETHIANGSVDLAITNVPFVTGLRVSDTTGDKDLSKKFHNIHDFCIAKNVRKLREGGLGIFITSNGTLDSSKKLRDWIVNEGGADFVGAFRMHNKTFGGTGVTSDIIVIRRRVNGKKSANAIDVSNVSGERTAEFDTGETRKVKGQIVPVVKQLSMDYNQYFIEHPENMAGEMHFAFEKGDTFRPTSKGLYPKQDKKQEQMLAEFVQSFSAEEFGSKSDDAGVTDVNPGKKVGEMFVKDGKLYINSTASAQPLDVNANKVKGHTKVECFEAYTAIKEALAEVIEYQTNNEDDKGLKPLLAKLNKAYDDFVKTYGHFNKNTAIAFLRNDVDYANVFALEKFEETADAQGHKVQKFGKTDVFSRRVVEKEAEPMPTNVKDGIIASIFKFGRVDVPYIAEQLGNSVANVKAEILESGYGFEDPATRQVEVSYQYLSGNIREKLRQAQENNANGEYDRNIKALQEVMPMTIPAHLIDFTLGSSWIEPKMYEDYVKERTEVGVQFTAVGGTWFMNEPYFTNYEKNRAMGVTSEMLGRTVMGHTLIEAAIQNRSITVSTTKKNWDGSTETITDKEATQACAAKIDEIRQDFKEWARQKMQSDAEMSERMEKVYNETFNNYVPMSIPDDFVPEYFGGASHKFKMRPHQGRAIVRGTMQPLLLAHEVGTGKTFTLISTAMEMRRLGTARKPMIVVQNATVGQFVASAKELYPNAKILTLEEADRSAEGRKNFYAKIKYNDWDMIVVPQSTFEFIPDSEERQMAFVQAKIEEKMLVLEKMKEADPDGKSMITRQAEKEIAQLEEELAGLSSETGKKRTANDEKKRAVALQNAEVKAMEMLDRRTDDVENFDDMGIDALLIDEAHEYKHLGFATAMQRGVKGVDPSYSKKSQGVFLKTQAVLEKNNGRNVIFATGTPISNTAAEIWTFMRYLMPADTMEEYGIYYFDDFVRNFGNIQQMLEFTTSGKFKENNRFAGYVNLPELVRIWSGVSDTVLTREAGGVSDKIPEMEGGKAQDLYLPQTRALRSIMKFVKAQLEEYDKMSGKEKKENSHIPLTMYGIAKAAAVDARLVQYDAEDDPQSKTNEAVRQTLRSLKETADYKGTVAIFADNYQNKESGFNLYEDIRTKLIAEGVPADEIVVIKSGMTVKKKLEIFEKVNRGEVRVILGSTFTLGTGVNIQERLHTLIHLDAPNRPMDYTQRNGRILRQGNLHKAMGKPVRVLRFGVEDSLDVTAYQRLKTKGAIADSIMNGKQMMANSMTNRVLEEEEDVFGDTVAQLSGSEYAMLKNNAEKNVRKFASRKKQWEADQTYIHNAKPRVKGFIKDAEQRIEKYSAFLDAVRAAFPDGKFTEIIIGKHRFTSIEAMEDFFKEHNKSVLAEMKQMKDGEIAGEQKRELTIQIGNFSFKVKTVLTKETNSNGMTLFTEAHKKMTYSCPELGIEDCPIRQHLLRNAVEDIIKNVITGKDFAERLEAAHRSKKHNEAELEQLLSREGKPFEYEAELVQAIAQYEEYSEAMKKELEEKEAKYAEMDANIETAENVSNTEEDDDTLYRSDDTMYRIRESAAPKNIGIGYKVFVLKNGELYPPMVANPNGDATPVGVWLDADAAPIAGQSKTGRSQVKAGGKGTQGGSGKLAYRPGWHLGKIPYALQFNRNDENGERTLFPKNFVWAEVEYANDVNYQEEAMSYGYSQNGKFQHSYAGLPRVPENGSYTYRTNPNPETDPWIITGAMRVKRLLTPTEIDEMVKAAGREPKPRQEGAVTDAEIEALNAEFVENYRTASELDQVNDRFNKELATLTDENADNKVLMLGTPSDILLSGGVENKPMKLYGNKVIKKMHKHGFTLSELNDLPKAVANPIAIFDGSINGSHAILTELKIEKNNILVSLSIGKNNDVDFNIVSSVYGKANKGVVNWINDGKLRYVSKKKMLDYLRISAPIAEAQSSQALSGAAKIVKDFENPSVEEEISTRREVTEAKRNRMSERVASLAEKLHLDNVEIVTDASTLEGKKQSAKGFYLKSTGKITIVIPNHTSVFDVEQTLLHEAVAHYGLRQLFGEHFDTFLDNVFNNAEKSIVQSIEVIRKNLYRKYVEKAIKGVTSVFEQAEIIAKLPKTEIDFTRTATEEYLATLAENTEFEEAQRTGWWQKIKDFFLDMLHRIGFEDFKDVTLSDNELRYILWRSYENLAEPGRYRSILGEAADVAKQYELKVGNYAENNINTNTAAENDDALYRNGDPEMYERALARERYEQRVRSGMFQSQEALQDSMLAVKDAMMAVLGEDKYIEDVDGFENAYLGENRLSSVNKAEADAFAHTLFKPMLDEVAKLAKNEAEREELIDYMMAKHGLERNEYMRQQAEANGEDADRDFAGLTALTGMDNVADAEAEAQQMVTDYEDAHDTTDLWEKVNAVSKAILQKSYECGMMSKETFDKVSDMYEFYIPLRGFDEKTSAEAYAYLTHKHSAFNAPIKKAEGRTSKADDPFANLESMAEAAIMQGNRNKSVKQRFLNFALNHPSDLVSVSDLWLEYDAVTDEWKPVFPDNIDSANTPDQVEQKMQDFETKMEALSQSDPTRYKRGKDAIGIPYRIVESRDMRQHQVVVKRNGRDYVITINGNPRAAQALNGHTNPDNDMSDAIGAILRAGEKINRQLSAFYTTRNPDFVVSNFVRDMLYTNTMAWIKESPNYALRFHRNYLMVNPVKMKILLAKYRNGTLDMSDKTDAMFYQFMMNGGETGYANIRDIEQHKNDIRRELKRANGKLKIGKAFSLLAERFDELNRAVENCARFAAFITSREIGRSIDRAIYDAKEISVNFNKKGSGAKFLNTTGQTKIGNATAFVSGLGRSGYVFWNAAIQGTTNFGRQLKRHPAKAFTGMAAMFLLGAIVAYLGGDDDEDDKNAYYNLPEYVRRSNILFRAGDSWISIPLPIEYRAFYGMGELMISVLSGKEHMTGVEIAEAIAGQATQILPIDFLEGGGGLNAFVPSVAKPLWEAYVAEKSWTGMPLYKDTPYNKDMPEWTKAYKSTNKHIVNLAATLNEATGGDPYTKGSIDFNPAKVEYLLNGYFGGVFGTIDKLTKTAETAFGDREYDHRSILLVNRLVKAGDERTEYRAVNNEYFRLKEEHDRLKTRLRHYEEDTDNGIFDFAEKIDFLYNSPEYERYEIFEDYRKDIDDLYDELKEAVDDDERKYIEAELNELKKELIQESNLTRKRK